MIALVVQLNVAFYQATAAYMHRREAFIATVCDNFHVEQRYCVMI